MTRSKKPSVFSPHSSILRKLGLSAENSGVFCGQWMGGGKVLKSISPIDGRPLASVRTAAIEQYEGAIRAASTAFQQWQLLPAPKRGEIIRQFGNALRKSKRDLGRLVTLETGKILA